MPRRLWKSKYASQLWAQGRGPGVPLNRGIREAGMDPAISSQCGLSCPSLGTGYGSFPGCSESGREGWCWQEWRIGSKVMKEKGIGKSRGSPYLGGKALEHPRDPTYSFQGLLVPRQGYKSVT